MTTAATMSQRGASLIEMMLALALGGMVIAAAAALVSSSIGMAVAQSEHADLQQRGAFAVSVLRRSLQVAGYRNWDAAAGAVSPSVPPAELAIQGRDNCAADLHACRPAPNQSDLIEIRHDGAGAEPGDGSVLDCAGQRVAAAQRPDALGRSRARNVFYVAISAHGEPALYCRYGTGAATGRAEALVDGVESFQVLYGVDQDGDGLPNQFLAARGMTAAHWPRVVAVTFTLVLRGSQRARHDTARLRWPLFGPRYRDSDGEFVPTQASHRPRQRFAATVILRNPLRRADGVFR